MFRKLIEKHYLLHIVRETGTETERGMHLLFSFDNLYCHYTGHITLSSTDIEHPLKQNLKCRLKEAHFELLIMGFHETLKTICAVSIVLHYHTELKFKTLLLKTPFIPVMGFGYMGATDMEYSLL